MTCRFLLSPLRAQAGVAVLLLLLTCLGACAGKDPATPQKNAPARFDYALDGPALFISGEYNGIKLNGSMDRTAMVGIGKLELQAQDPAQGFFCEARLTQGPGPKGRIPGVLTCTEGEILFFSMRNTGPDQGVGLGKSENGQDILTFFYHSCPEESVRRHPGERALLLHAARKIQAANQPSPKP